MAVPMRATASHAGVLAGDHEHHEFNCGVCLDALEEPTTLVCNHSFCRSCIRELPGVKNAEQQWEQLQRVQSWMRHRADAANCNSARVQCPVCRASVTIPIPLPVNTTMRDLLKTVRDSSSEQLHVVPATDVTRGREIGRRPGGGTRVLAGAWAGHAVALRELLIPAGEREAEELRTALRRQAAAAGKLRHPSIVQVYGLVAAPRERFAVVCERASGSLRSARISPAEALDCARQVAAGLAFLHGRCGAAHGRLRPPNVLIFGATGASRAYKIADVGASEPAGADAYSAPELLTSIAPRPTPAADVFAAAVLFNEALSGRPPFPDLPPMDVLRRIANGERPELAAWPPALANLIRRMWDQEPTKRPSAAEAARALSAAAAAPDAISFDPPSPVGEIRFGPSAVPLFSSSPPLLLTGPRPAPAPRARPTTARAARRPRPRPSPSSSPSPPPSSPRAPRPRPRLARPDPPPAFAPSPPPARPAPALYYFPLPSGFAPFPSLPRAPASPHFSFPALGSARPDRPAAAAEAAPPRPPQAFSPFASPSSPAGPADPSRPSFSFGGAAAAAGASSPNSGPGSPPVFSFSPSPPRAPTPSLAPAPAPARHSFTFSSPGAAELPPSPSPSSPVPSFIFGSPASPPPTSPAPFVFGGGVPPRPSSGSDETAPLVPAVSPAPPASEGAASTSQPPAGAGAGAAEASGPPLVSPLSATEARPLSSSPLPPSPDPATPFVFGGAPASPPAASSGGSASGGPGASDDVPPASPPPLAAEGSPARLFEPGRSEEAEAPRGRPRRAVRVGAPRARARPARTLSEERMERLEAAFAAASVSPGAASPRFAPAPPSAYPPAGTSPGRRAAFPTAFESSTRTGPSHIVPLPPPLVTYPPAAALSAMSPAELASVRRFTVSHPERGSITWDGPLDLRGACLPGAVEFHQRSVRVDPATAPALAGPALVVLKGVRRRNDYSRLRFELERYCLNRGARFISYDPRTLEWRFSAPGFPLP
eukprot:tig00000760_g3937.t1